MTAGEIAMAGSKLKEYRMGQLAGVGIIRYADVFGDAHLEEFCHRAQFGDMQRAKNEGTYMSVFVI